jgi:hypothetical protein
VIEKAAESVGRSDVSLVDTLTDAIVEKLVDFLVESDGNEFVTIEFIQDLVERELMES